MAGWLDVFFLIMSNKKRFTDLNRDSVRDQWTAAVEMCVLCTFFVLQTAVINNKIPSPCVN